MQLRLSDPPGPKAKWCNINVVKTAILRSVVSDPESRESDCL
jgi:hypothetical protein